MEQKKLIAKGDQQQEKLGELRNEVNRAAEALAEEQTKAVDMAMALEEAIRDWMELTR